MNAGLPLNEVKAELVRRGLTQRSLAEGLGVSRPAVTYVLHRQSRSARIRRAVAVAIERPYDEVWGEPDPETNLEKSA